MAFAKASNDQGTVNTSSVASTTNNNKSTDEKKGTNMSTTTKSNFPATLRYRDESGNLLPWGLIQMIKAQRSTTVEIAIERTIIFTLRGKGAAHLYNEFWRKELYNSFDAKLAELEAYASERQALWESQQGADVDLLTLAMEALASDKTLSPQQAILRAQSAVEQAKLIAEQEALPPVDIDREKNVIMEAFRKHLATVEAKVTKEILSTAIFPLSAKVAAAFEQEEDQEEIIPANKQISKSASK